MAAVKPTTTRTETLLSRRQVEGLIAEGRAIIIVDQKVLKVDSWLKYHPGGDKAIRHMVGRDATDEVNALHSPEARKQMDRYRIGRVEGHWANFVPPIQGGEFRPYIIDALDQENEEDIAEAYPHSHTGSRSPSPVFDTEASILRPRVASRYNDVSSSASSVSSVTEPDDGMSWLDVRTKEHIDLDLAKYPSLDPATQDEVVRKYRLLEQRIRAEGLYDCNYSAYAIETCRYTFLACMTLLCLRWGWYATSGMFLGCLWHQLVFTVHDAGHMGITHNFTIDSTIGIVIANFMGGLSVGWWKRNHNVHHIVTNSPEHDPDIEHLPFLAISHRFLESLTSSFYERVMAYDAFAKLVIPYQHYLYYPILTFGRFNLYRLSWEHLILGLGPRKGRAWWHRWLEIVGQVFFWYWFGYGIMYKTIPTASARIAFLMVSHMVTMPLHAQITLSHFAMSTSELGPRESFPQKMLRTTMDIDCPQWLDFFHGGLQFQAVHHLFPRMPRHNLRRTQKLVQEFCDEVEIPYALYGFVEGSQQVIGTLEEVGRQAAVLAKCQRALAQKGDILHGH
ncbi:putative delta 8-sphingolipid desaturase [Venustampulla echinocandica]|uniref:Delta 8-(E)-sphingolipid desaturase n=1 Tax=Venustampulla echinocandica TaxID=2656787 RepID=A0A370TDC3_9HELO|nr:putative delta 8-sphingolipid desaturase [Venustampulla echinocandica]RDL32457.1 putative delta 8-sphingolipid desaturase [Venustampulla echinocandica]